MATINNHTVKNIPLTSAVAFVPGILPVSHPTDFQSGTNPEIRVEMYVCRILRKYIPITRVSILFYLNR